MPRRMVSLLALGFVLVVCAVAPRFLAAEREALADERVRRTLDRYARDGLFSNEFLDADLFEFSIPKVLLDFSGGTEWGQVLEESRRARSIGLDKVEESVSLRGFLEFVGNSFVLGSRLRGVTVNSAPKADRVNLYFLKGDPAGLAARFSGNCTYIGWQNAVLCDSDWVLEMMLEMDNLETIYDTFILELFFDGKGGRLNLEDGENKELVRRYLRSNFIIWLLGHEIAHAVLHRKEVLGSASNLHFELDYTATELEADEYVAHLTARGSALGVRFKVILGEFIQQEFRREAVRSGAVTLAEATERDYIFTGRISLTAGERGVPVLLRAIRVMQAVYASREGIDDTGSYGVKSGHLFLVNSIIPSSPYESILERVNANERVYPGANVSPILVLTLVAVCAASVSSLALSDQRR